MLLINLISSFKKKPEYLKFLNEKQKYISIILSQLRSISNYIVIYPIILV